MSDQSTDLLTSKFADLLASHTDLLTSKFADLLASHTDRLVEKLQAAKRSLSPADYAKSHSVGLRTVYRAIAEQRLTHSRVGRRVLIPADAVIGNPPPSGVKN